MDLRKASEVMSKEQAKWEKAKSDKAKPDEPNMACNTCEKWCFLRETLFSSVEEATEKEYRCQICANVDGVKGALEQIRKGLGVKQENTRKAGNGYERGSCTAQE